MLWPATLLAQTDPWDIGAKVLAAMALVASPILVAVFTRRAARGDREAAERTEVEKLYIAGSKDLILHLQGELIARSTELAAARRKIAVLQEEIDTANQSFAAYQEQYRRLLELLRRAGVAMPEETGGEEP
jgi:predicted S18 family serine protease